ncbi:MAG: DUF120 domain-containing protein [Deltaproteobacteria bacterium]|nr:DUF120 domain-containing protein [Deltaproteobacteria bacterium]
MALDWVQDALLRSLGFAPYPATLNVRPLDAEDARLWQMIQREFASVPLLSVDGDFCSARLYWVGIQGFGKGDQTIKGAVLLPDVADYPKDKIEIVAPVRLKGLFGLKDGDRLALEFND